jgi:hypothetical protein
VQALCQGSGCLLAAEQWTAVHSVKAGIAQALGQRLSLFPPNATQWQVIINAAGNNFIFFWNGITVADNKQFGRLVTLE